MYYLIWRVLTDLHKEVKISFLPVRHTKFAPDLFYWSNKAAFSSNKFGDLENIANCISLSSSINVPQLVGSLDGTTFVSTYNWIQYLDEFTIKTALKGISNVHHFRFLSGSLEAVFVKSDSSAAKRKIILLKDTSWVPSVHQLPPVIIPMGLSAKWQLYLYEKIREFCPPEKQDSAYPKPV